MRTMARHVCAFSVAKLRGWDGDADRLIAHGIAFTEKGRTQRGGWARLLQEDGMIADACEYAYDHACVLLMLAHAHQTGNPDAPRLGQETFAFSTSTWRTTD
jgi:mannose/cellobiose epimerase-like protein (N-acyl-D-glucosamine 2-epimerase family)